MTSYLLIAQDGKSKGQAPQSNKGDMPVQDLNGCTMISSSPAPQKLHILTMKTCI